MANIFENKFYRLLLLIVTLVIVIGYAWLGSAVLAPRLTLPASVAATAVIEKGEAHRWEDVFSRHSYALTSAVRELETFEAAVKLVGGLSHPVDLALNMDEPQRYLVTDTRVEIGSAWLINRGQLAKGFMKAWVYQRARKDIAGSLLRAEIVSDLLWAMLRGHLELEAPDAKLGSLALRFPRVAHWMLTAASFRSYCRSPWRSLELQPLCSTADADSSNSLSAVSFRPLIGSMIWDVFQSRPFLSRVDFIRVWSNWIIQGPSADDTELPEKIPQWRSWIRAEFEKLLPPDHAAFQMAIDETLAKAALSEPKGFDVDVMFRSKAASVREAEQLATIIATGNERLWKLPVVAVVETKDGLLTLPGLARVSSPDDESLRVRQLVWEECKPPAMKAVIDDAVRSQRILFVKACEAPLSASYSPLVTLGIQGFAIANPNVEFASMRKPSIELAAKRRLISGDSVLSDLLRRTDGGKTTLSRELGIQDAKWIPELKAYKVLGAVEAVEWFRSQGEHDKKN